MISNRGGTKYKPQDLVVAKPQGKTDKNSNSNSTTLRESKSRHDKGMELYKTGKVSIGSNGLFKVSGYYEADTEKMTCTCPDYKTRKEPCKHIYAACLFVKNRGKVKIEDLSSNPKTEPKDIANKPAEAPSKPFDSITRLAVINSAIELLKTHRKPIEPADVISTAVELEKFAKNSLR